MLRLKLRLILQNKGKIKMENRNDYLMHYGVLGMKWGVRRYQRKDGTRTTLGKAHERKLSRQREKKPVDEDYLRAHGKSPYTKNVKFLSTDELDYRITRLNKETTYNELLKSKWTKTGENILFGYNKEKHKPGIFEKISEKAIDIGASFVEAYLGIYTGSTIEKLKNKLSN